MVHARLAGRRGTVLLTGLAVVVLVLAGGWALLLRPSDADGTEVTYRAAAVTTGTLRQTVAASGTVAATDTEDLTFAASGEVTAVWVIAGQKVAKGQRLAAIDSAALKSAVAAAKATLATAQAKLASDTASGATSTQLAADSAEITVARAQVTQATADLAGATLTAPFAGTVTSVGYTVGQQVGSSSESSSGSRPDSDSDSDAESSSDTDTSTAASDAITLVSTGSYVVDAGVDASDIGLIAKGNQVLITVGDATKTVFGTVSSVGIVATTSSGVATFPVVVAVTGSPTGVYPGATASLQIVYKQLSDVLLVPTQAISRTDGGSTVLVQKGDAQERRTIRTGLSSGPQTQVINGLTEGEQVLVPAPTGTGGGSTTDGRTGRTGPGTGGGKLVDDGPVPGGGKGSVRDGPGGPPGKGSGP